MNSLLQDIPLKVTKNEGTLLGYHTKMVKMNPYVYTQKSLTHTAYDFVKEGLCETCIGTLMFLLTGPRWRKYGIHLRIHRTPARSQRTTRVAGPVSVTRNLAGTDPPERRFPYRARRLLARLGNSGIERQNLKQAYKTI